MNRFLFRFCIVVCLLALPIGDAVLRAAESYATVASTDTDEPEHVDVSVREGYIYVNTSRSMTISLYSILGQLIVRQTVHPGTTRIKAPARGVYILKAGSATRRVTVN